ncbi:MFS transporter [Dongia soli]|uniref:MFS transporter n=1 Tax=Dongia soli TaxID=600628 RepID=A0ABU5EFV0_9PROT|nr:MFS transporter [Dongia soli]MDY0884328.1 MFS transporter [Dongia soli]
MNAEELTEPASPLPLSASALFFLPLTVACGNFMVNLDQNIVVTALPGISLTLGHAPSQLGLVITVYVLSLIVSMPLGRWLTGRFGTKACYCGALLSFAAASIACGLATSLWTLVLARALQGFGGALMGTVGQVAILRAFPRSRILKINIYMSLASQLGPLVGPLVGGALTTYLSWHWIFFINVPLALGAAALAISYFPPKSPGRVPRLDLIGFLLMSAGMTLLVFSMDSFGDHAYSGWSAISLLMLSVLLLGTAVFYLRQTHNPLLDLRLLNIRTIRISLLTGGGLDPIGLTSVTLLLPMMFQVGFGMTAVESGSWTFVIGIGSVLSRFFLPRLLKQWGFRRILVWNTPVAAALVGGFALFQATTPMWLGLSYIFIFGLFRSVQWGTASNLSYADVTGEQLADFSALYYIFWRLAVSISIGSASALLSLLASGDGSSSPNDFRIIFIVEALITLGALFAYRRLTADDGAAVSGYRSDLASD